MSDLYSSEQSKRLFGFIAAGGSLGTILGPDSDPPAGGADRRGQSAAGVVGAADHGGVLRDAARRRSGGGAGGEQGFRGRQRGSREAGGGWRHLRRLQAAVQVALPGRHCAVGVPAVADGHVPVLQAGGHRGRHTRSDSAGAHQDLRHHRPVGGHTEPDGAGAADRSRHQVHRRRICRRLAAAGVCHRVHSAGRVRPS